MTASSARSLSPHDVRPFLSLLHDTGGVFEIRVPKYGKYKSTASGYFNDIDAAAQAVVRWDGKANIYVTLNSADPALLARAANRIVERAESTTADADVVRRRWLFIDIDPARASGISSTGDELLAATGMADAAAAFLRDAGWPDPVMAMSGNGAYLVYRIDLANDAESTDLIRRVLEALAARFDTAGAHIDRTVFNASRIIGLIGTLKVKGDPMPDRPHRRSSLLSVPDVLCCVTPEQLKALAAPPTPKTSVTTTGGSTERLTDILRRHNIEFQEQPPDANGITWYHVRQCPFHEDGRPFECGVGQTLPDGPYAGKCFHPQGDGKGWQGWKVALALDVGRRAHDQALMSRGALPQICVSNRHRKDIAQDSWDALLAANDPPRLFRHGRGIAGLARDEQERLLISHLTLPALAGHVDRCADFMKATDNGLAPARPPRDVIEDMDAMAKPLPVLRGIVGTPTFSRDGTLVTEAGYQASTRLFYEPVGELIAAVPQTPDATHLRMAREIILLDWLGDFPFVDDASRANAIAIVITGIAREMIGGSTPLFAIDTPAAGTGKGLLVSGVGNVISGAEPPVMSELRDENEFRKLLTAKLCEGAPLLLFDNVKRRLDSGSLAAALTAEIWSDRILGGSKSADVPVRNVWICTGNNMQLTDEIARRSVWIRMDARRDRPWEGRSFRHPDLKAWLRTHRHELVWAFLVLVQNWVARGRPAWSGAVLGSYEDWSRVVGGVLAAACIGGFMENREQLYDRVDAVSEEWRRFIRIWWENHGEQPVAIGELLDAAQDLLPSVFSKARDGASDRALRTRFGKALAEQRDRRFGDHFIRYEGIDKHTKGALWALECADDDEPFAEPLDEHAATSAEVPQDKPSTTDSFAEVAEVAEDDPGSIANKSPSMHGESFVGRTTKTLPQVPQLPQTDSISSPDDAEPVRKTAVESGEVPRCTVCPRTAQGHTEFGTPVCGMHAAQTQQEERKFGRTT